MTTIEPVIAAGDLRTVVRAGDAGAYHRMGAASVNDAGDIAFVAEADHGEVIMLAGREEPLVRAGDTAPDGRTFRSFPEIDLGVGGQLAFRARLDDAAEGVFLHTPQGIRTMAVTGGASPGGNVYASFAALSMASTVLEDGPYHRLAFLADLADGRRSLVIAPSYTEPAEVLTTGACLGADVVEDLAISRVGFSVSCVATVRRAGVRVRTIVIAHEGAVAWAPGAAEGDSIDGLPAITRIRTPPGCHSEMAFVAVDLAGGGSALIARPVLADPSVLARSGDALPDGRIARFGPPVASSGLPACRPFGLASAVTLDDGRAGVWVAALTTATPLRGQAAFPVLDGDRTDDAGPLEVRDPRPVALTNTGILLLRADLGPAGDRRPGLLVIDHLLEGLARPDAG